MTEQEAFQQIDSAIENFKKTEGLYKGIRVSTDPKSDWLSFNWRQLTWAENNIHYLIEIYPKFDQHEIITAWTMDAAAYFDHDKKRHYISKTLAENKTIDFIAENAHTLLSDGFKYLGYLKEKDIPVAVSLR